MAFHVGLELGADAERVVEHDPADELDPAGELALPGGRPLEPLDAANDTLVGFERLVGSGFDDALIGSAGNDVILGLSGDDFVMGGAGADHLDGGDGPDTVSYGTSGSGVSVSLASGRGSGGDAAGDLLLNFERLVGSGFDDVLIGSAGNDVILGLAGDDFVQGGAGADYLVGGAGPDTLSYAASSSGVSVNLTSGTGQGGDAEGDVVLDFERLVGSGFNDSLVGGVGGDVLLGGAGTDTLTGGAGADVFVFAAIEDSRAGIAQDVVADFSRGRGGPDLALPDHAGGIRLRRIGGLLRRGCGPGADVDARREHDAGGTRQRGRDGRLRHPGRGLRYRRAGARGNGLRAVAGAAPTSRAGGTGTANGSLHGAAARPLAAPWRRPARPGPPEHRLRQTGWHPAARGIVLIGRGGATCR